MSGLITNYLGVGLAAARPATPSITSGGISFYLASDTGAVSIWGGSWATLGAGTVTSITGSGGTTGLTLGGGPITTSGTLTLSGTLVVANGGTGATTAAGARTNLGATTVGANVFTLSDPGAITFPRFNADNTVDALSASAFRTAIGAGTGSGGGDMLSTLNLSDVASAATSRSNLGLAIGTDVQAYNANLTTYAGIAPSANVQSLLGAANYAAIKTLLALTIGTNVQAWDADLDALAAASGTNTIYYRSAANTWSAVTIGTNLTFSGGTLAASGGTGGLLPANNLSDVASIIAAADHLFTKGTDIASAATTDLATATGNFVDVTGTTTITALGTLAAGVERTVRFTGILTLTYNATSLILPTAANITTAAGDVARFRSLGSGNWVCVAYQRASGQALAPSTQYYRIGFFFTTTPTVSEVVALHVVTDAFTFPANFATPDSKGSCGTNPTASFALDVQKNGSSIGTITISTGGAFTFATASGTSKSIAAGDVIKVVAPSPVDPTCANVAITLKGTI